MKRFLTKELLSERASAGLLCAALGLIPFAAGGVALAFVELSGPGRIIAIAALVYGALCLFGGWMVGKGSHWVRLLASAMFVVNAVFAVVVGWNGPVSLLAGILPLGTAAYFYFSFRDGPQG